MTKEERISWLKTCTARQRKEYYQAILMAGCAACGAPYRSEGPNRTTVHHCYGHGFPAKRDHRPVVGLCAFTCHQNGPDAIHSGKRSFEDRWGTQQELLKRVEQRVD